MVTKTGDEGIAICAVCIRSCKQKADMEPHGAVACTSCGSYDGVRIQYSNGSSARWMFGGLDSSGRVIYTVISSKGNFNHLNRPMKLYCAACEHPLPLDLILLSGYLYKRPGKKA